MKLQSAALAGLCAAVVLATPASRPDNMSESDAIEQAARALVELPSGGIILGRSVLEVESFNAIPYADPPVGPLRLKPPKKFSGVFGIRDGRGPAPACPQMSTSRENFDTFGALSSDVSQIPFLKPTDDQEDCLTVNVQRPAGTNANMKLPVLFWIYGGGFEVGATDTYDATSLLGTAVSQEQAFIFVAVNYRVGGFGFLPGTEVLADGSANIGLLDQRMGLEWVADNIAAFGGDPSKVTIWGESAGAISVLDQMALYDGNATYKGKTLFRGAIMNSGSIAPADRVDCPKGQAVYDQVVDKAGCSNASDTLECLRAADYDTFLNAANSMSGINSSRSLALSYMPRPDGKALTQSPERLLQAGRYHAVPMIIGDQEDEGTTFALVTPNITTEDQMVDYLLGYYFHRATKDKLRELVKLYELYELHKPNEPAILNGSPIRIDRVNDLERIVWFKRVAAILGDLAFTLTRRFALDLATTANPNIPAWSYLSSYLQGLPLLGTFHASDIIQVFYGLPPNHAMRSCRTYYFNFLYNQDPNKGVSGFAKWPLWKRDRKLMWFKTDRNNSILDDDFRSEAADFIEQSNDTLYM